ncbi:MAG: VOC family protein [Vicinamibacterales bacterium]
MPNPVVHFEILATDGAKAQQFYADAFGWSIDANNPMQYGVVSPQEGHGIGGGVAASQPGQPSGVTVYIEVTDIPAALAKVEAAGGKTVMPETEIPGMVTFAQFADPAGNVVGLVKANSMA